MIVLRVIHSVGTWLPQTQTWLYEQLRNMPAEDIDHIIAADYVANLDQFPMPLIYSLEKSSPVKKFLKKAQGKLFRRTYSPVLEDVCRKEKAEILHSHFGNTAWRNLLVARKYGLRHVVTFYGFDVTMLPRNPVWQTRYRELFAQVDRVLCEGPFMASQIERLGCPPEKVKVQRLGITLKKIPFSPRRFGPDKEVNILIAGTFREKKGIPDALRALAALKARFDHFQVTIIGDATSEARDQREKELILRIVRENTLEDKVTFLGFMPHHRMITLAYEHDIFLSPSLTASDGDTEGGAPVTIIEMAASGMPVVSTTHCDIPNVLGEANRRLLVAERDSEGLARVLYELISGQVDVEALEQENREFIEQYLDSRKCAQSLLGHYREVAGEC